MTVLVAHGFNLEGLSVGRGVLNVEEQAPGVTDVNITVTYEVLSTPEPFSLKWRFPINDVQGLWHPGADRQKQFHADWSRGFKSKVSALAPVLCLFNNAGANRLTFALSDALHAVDIRAGVNEETAMFHCSIGFFIEPTAPIQTYQATVRIDTRHLLYYDALWDVSRWWASMPGYAPTAVPETARLPMYSTWYSFHQAVNPSEVEEQCRMSKALGCDAVIIDDGWQTTSNARGYAYCGDWQVAEEKIPNMRGHIARIHEQGMKAILWYSVPFVGIHSEVWKRFEDKLLYRIDQLGAGVLDPRYPEVREYLITTYENAVRVWNLDGLKLDFIDSFNATEHTYREEAVGVDPVSVPEAVDVLMSEVIERLKVIKPDIMIEFRQAYIGPLMRKYGNMFRAADCPNDGIQNRVRTLDVRLLCGETACHSDMIMWNPEEPVESAALQMLNILFSVPQVSVRLENLPQDHQQMVKFWLAFWREHRDVLLDGKLVPHHPELLYPLVESSTKTKHVVAVYSDMVVPIHGPAKQQWILVNATHANMLVCRVSQEYGLYRLEVKSAEGKSIQTDQVTLSPGFLTIDIPRSGVAVLTQVNE